eukprot:3001352-Rhodomonas_salina.1
MKEQVRWVSMGRVSAAHVLCASQARRVMHLELGDVGTERVDAVKSCTLRDSAGRGCRQPQYFFLGDRI